MTEELPRDAASLKIFDYINMPRTERFRYHLPGLENEVSQLKHLGIIRERILTDYRGNEWTSLFVAGKWKRQVDAALKAYYLLFTEEELSKRVERLYNKDKMTCLAMANLERVGFDLGEGFERLEKLTEDLATEGFGFMYDYFGVYDDLDEHWYSFQWRLRPFNGLEAFERLVPKLAIADPERTLEEQWLLYLVRHLGARRCRSRRTLNENMASFLPGPTYEAIERVGLLIEEEIDQIDLSRISEELAARLYVASERDADLVRFLRTLLTFSKKTDSGYEIINSRLRVMKIWNPDCAVFLNALRSKGLILRDERGNIVIPLPIVQTLKRIETGTSLNFYVMDRYLASEDVMRRILSETKSVALWDPWVNCETIARIASLGPRIRSARVLSSLPGGGKGQIEQEIRNLDDYARRLCAKGFDVMIKLLYWPETPSGKIKPLFHDRFLMTDCHTWLMGSSLKDLGSKFSVLLKLRDDFASMISSEFEKYWNTNELPLRDDSRPAARILPSSKSSP